MSFGETETDRKKQKKTATVIALCECVRSVEEFLQRPPDVDVAEEDASVAASYGKDPPAHAKEQVEFLLRDEHAYMTLRGIEKSRCCLAVRVEIAEDIELLHWERAFEGLYTSNKKRTLQHNMTKRPKKNAYTRILIGKIILRQNVGFIGKELIAAVVHLHFTLGNKCWHGFADITTSTCSLVTST